MRDHLRKIKQNVAKRAAAYATYMSTVDALDKDDAEHLMGIKSAGVSNAAAAGYIGAASKAIINSKSLHDGLGKATESHCSIVGKCMDGIAKVLNVDIRDRSNANEDDARECCNPTHDGESMEGTSVEHGLKGAKASDLQKMADSLPGSTLLTSPVGVAVRKLVGRSNANKSADPFGFSKAAPVTPIQGQGRQNRVLSEYDKRHQK